MTKPKAFLDSCVLYPYSLRDLLIQFSVENLYQAKWSSLVKFEVIRNIEAKNPKVRGKLSRTFSLMEKAIPDFSSEPTRKTRLLVKKSNTDPKDIDILASAIDGACTHLVTSNIKDFDITFALSYKVIVIHPDDFLSDLIHRNPTLATSGFETVVKRCQNPPRSKKEYCEALKKAI